MILSGLLADPNFGSGHVALSASQAEQSPQSSGQQRAQSRVQANAAHGNAVVHCKAGQEGAGG